MCSLTSVFVCLFLVLFFFSMFLRFIHFVACVSSTSLLLFLAFTPFSGWVILPCMSNIPVDTRKHILFIRWLVDGYLHFWPSGIPLLWIYIVSVSMWACYRFSWAVLLGHKTTLDFLSEELLYCFLKATAPFSNPSRTVLWHHPISLPLFIIIFLKNCNHPSGCQVDLIIFICISLVTDDTENLFISL